MFKCLFLLCSGFMAPAAQGIRACLAQPSLDEPGLAQPQPNPQTVTFELGQPSLGSPR